MLAPIDFYFDFSSPYAYLGSHMIEDVAAKHARTVNWHAFMLGIAFKNEKTAPLTFYPRKGEYSRMDFARTARKYDIPFSMPDDFPKNTIAASRAFFYLNKLDPLLAKTFGKTVFQAYFVQGLDISDTAVVLELARECGIDVEALELSMQSAALKDEFKMSVNEIIEEKKVFGAPFFVVDGEPFWGADRVVQVGEWLETGGW
ncbi:2-hydroxychromene-2-carboxylate isomerase [Sneathiella aquimaris]|uniref:2-hydroxychromene-2-carboxylate isomerase n=1 Tax=Sneathiella aquimaris TaxID=2599305 RepID=UPI00146E84EC|nr:2-hydroxychromene-2-carboxylate isomerase [Sneathiella aquimaris]